MGGLHVNEHWWTIDKPMASLSTCIFGPLAWMANIVKSQESGLNIVEQLLAS